MVALLVVITILRGKGNGYLSTVYKCSSTDWSLLAIFLIGGAIIIVIAVILLKKEYKDKLKANYDFVEGDLIFNHKIVAKLIIMGFFAGILAGILGIGSALILNPMLILLGMNPIVATETGMYIGIYSAFSAAI